jgi:hypothetical protein
MQENENELTENNSMNSKANQTNKLGILEKLNSLKNYRALEEYSVCFLKYSVDSTLDNFTDKFISENKKFEKNSIGQNVK